MSIYLFAKLCAILKQFLSICTFSVIRTVIFNILSIHLALAAKAGGQGDIVPLGPPNFRHP